MVNKINQQKKKFNFLLVIGYNLSTSINIFHLNFNQHSAFKNKILTILDVKTLTSRDFHPF